MSPIELRQRPSFGRVHPLLLVVIGGGVGSLARHSVVSIHSDPVTAVFLLNIAGSLLLGSLTAWTQHSASTLHGPDGELRGHWSALLGLGFCGGLTTFSTHMVDVAQRLNSSAPSSAVIPLVATTAMAIMAAGAGYEGTRRQIALAGHRGGEAQ